MKKTYKLENLDCANCAAKMEAAINKLGGVTKATVGFLSQKLTLETEADDQASVLEQVIKVCRKVEPDCVIHQ